ncbi:hypothetical protein [Rhizobium arsenicireducens]
MAFPNHMQADEQAIVGGIIRRALAGGHEISIHDEEELVLSRSRDYEVITAEVAATDLTTLVISGLGSILLIHGNGQDVVSDCTDSPKILRLINVCDEDSFQYRVNEWAQDCFGAEISADRLERGDRLLEEVLELLQATGYPRERVGELESYVFNRPIGEPAQEVGGVMVTLAAHCQAHDIDMQRAAENELARIETKVEAIRAKQAAKPKYAVGGAG